MTLLSLNQLKHITMMYLCQIVRRRIDRDYEQSLRIYETKHSQFMGIKISADHFSH